jgi:hypothetical protein
MGRRQRQAADTPVADPSGPAFLLSLSDIVGLALIALRWFTPTEGTFRGDTLRISQVWLGWAVLCAWSAMREGDRWTRRGGLWSWGLLLLWSGHIASCLAVVATQGQKRAAINGLWEWTSLGLAAVWFSHRSSSTNFRRTFRLTLIASAVGLSTLGLWQRWVSQPALGRAVVEFDQLEARLQTLEGPELRDAESRMRTLRQTVGHEYTNLDDAGRRAMRQRLIESTEPLGRFALTNSFAAILLVALILLLGEMASSWRNSSAQAKSSQATRAFLLAITLLIAFVLLLTKSRTAVIALVAGSALSFVVTFRGRFRTALFWGFLGTGALGILLLVAWAAGGLDRYVFSEAPKSLEYRTEYWIGAWRVIQDHPWLGVGVGNFRQHYLQHKLAKSSEEVLDPHDFLLEAWVTGGIIAFAGLAVLIFAALAGCRRRSDPPIADSPATDWRTSAPSILCVAIGLLFAEQWLLEGLTDGELVAIGGLSILAAFLLNRATRFSSPTASVWTDTATKTAWFALSVHLLGAGGMEMPAIIQLWLCLSALAASPAHVETAAPRQWPTYAPGLVCTVAGLLFFTHLATATVPSMKTRAFANLADAEALVGLRPDRIDERLKDAAAADRFDPEPWRRRAQFAFQQWMRLQSDEWFDQAIADQHAAIARDPHHPHDQRLLAEFHLRRFAIDNRPADAEAAVNAARKSLELYPNQVAGRRVLAESLAAAGQNAEAAKAARHTLELDDLWLKLGHVDKTLPPPDRTRMEELANAS